MIDILQLYPKQRQQTLNGLYLQLNLNEQAAQGDVLIYANYIVSVDGRISLRDSESGEFMVPESIANKRDWRLYQELAAQADVMITSARYFRQLAKGNAQDLLPVGTTAEYADLAEWRQQQGMKAQPDVVVVSHSLDIPLAALEKVRDRRVLICSCEQANDRQRARLESSGFPVVMAGEKMVEGVKLKQLLISEQYRSAYMIAGPEVHRTLIAGGVLDRLFLTTHLSLLAGNDFHTILSGDIGGPKQLDLVAMYLDQGGLNLQLLAQYGLNDMDNNTEVKA